MFRRSAQNPSTSTLHALTGAQRGAVIRLTETPLRIGAGEGCDHLLLEREAGDAEVSVHRDEKNRPAVLLEAGAAWLGGRELRVGKAATARQGDVLVMGQVRLAAGETLEDARGRVVGAERGKAQLTWAAAAFAGLGCAGLIALYGGAHGGYAASVPKRNALTTENAQASAYMPGIARQALVAELEAVGLDMLEVGLDREAAALRVSGALTDPERGRWSDIRQWFDGAYGDDISLRADITQARGEIVLPFAIRSIWTNPTPRVVLHDGVRRGVGDTLPGGWRVEAIETGAVTVSRGEDRLFLSL